MCIMSTEAVSHKPPEDFIIPNLTDIVFLAGPIQGARDWQAEATELIGEYVRGVPKVHIANPRRDDKGEEFDYTEQVRWERKQLFRAFTGGVALFWLEAQDPDLPYKSGRAYGQTTRFEFGMAYTSHRIARAKFVLGIHPDYEGSEKYYRDLADELVLPVHDTLDAACQDVAMQVSIYNPDEAF